MSDEQRRHPLPEQYDWQFRRLIQYGYEDHPGWRSIVLDAVERVEQLLTRPEERVLFSWRQVKEKWGRLQLYATFGVSLDRDMMFNEDEVRAEDGLAALQALCGDMLEIDEHGRVTLTVKREVRTSILQIAREAERKSGEVCAICGAPGRLIRGGYWRARCKEHEGE